MRRQPNRSWSAITASGAALLLAVLGASSAFTQGRNASGSAGETAIWASLRNARGTLVGSLRMADCSDYPVKPCRDYLINALEYRLPGLSPTKLTVTDLDLHKVIFVDRDVYAFLYMFPLNQWGSLLATVWGSGTTNGIVEVYRLEGDWVKRVFQNGSRFSPQFIAGNEGTPYPLIMLGRYGGGAAMVPTDTEIWQWDESAGKFVLRATVPASQRFGVVARLEREAQKR